MNRTNRSIELNFSSGIYAARRAKLAAQLGPNSIALIPTAPEILRNRDNEFAYRHDSYFYYLTGFKEPNAYLILTSEGEATLLCQPHDETREIWTGYRLGPQAAIEVLGFQRAYSIDEIEKLIPSYLENKSTLWYPFATHDGLAQRIEGWLQKVRSRARFGILTPDKQLDVCNPLDEMRVIKDAHEISIMRKAAQISAQGHIQAMKHCAAMVRSGQELREYHLDAQLLFEFRNAGAEGPSFGSIVASGPNACVLHSRATHALIHDGELVLIDAGCEFQGYAGDISRTFPANGRFTPAQRDLYDLVLAAQQSAIDACRPGERFTLPHERAVHTLTAGLIDLGLLDKNKVGNLEDAIANRAYFQFYMHRTGHWLGLDVHDCGSYLQDNEIGRVSERIDPISGETILDRPARILQEGMVMTIEPGLYVRPSSTVAEKYWNTAIRIEDDALITSSGCDLLTRDAPVSVKDIEQLMA